MKYKINQILYRSSWDEDTGKCELDEYMIRTIRGGFVYAIAKINRITWGKRSSKIGDIGWLNPIDSVFKYRIEKGRQFTFIHTTKRKAWLHLLKESETYHYSDSEEIKKKIAATCKRMITRIKNNGGGK